MAREIHDLVGHSVNVMLIHAGAGRRALPDDIDGARRAFETIEQTGRTALEELDGVLGILRNSAPDGARPLPGIADLADLTSRFRSAGLEVQIDSTVDVPVPLQVGSAVYRLVQEALTNTLKHASATVAHVVIALEHSGLRITVSDDGTGSTGVAGHGLRGMAERVGLLGGTLECSDSPDGGFVVSAQLPIEWSP